MKKLLLICIITLSLVSCIADGDINARKGVVLYDNKQYFEAIQYLNKAINEKRRVYSTELVYTIIGNAYMELEEYDNSLESYSKSVEINPDFYRAWVNMGIVFRLLGEFEKAENCYLKALEIEPEYAELHVSLGALYIYINKSDKALASLEHAIKLDPMIATSYSNYAIALAQVGRFEEAEKSLKKAIFLGYENGDNASQMIENLRQQK